MTHSYPSFPSFQSWKIEIINQPQKRFIEERKKRAFDSINQTFLILIPKERERKRGASSTPKRRNETFSPFKSRLALSNVQIIYLQAARRPHPPIIWGDKEMKIHHRHQQANISNSIFKLNIVRFMHTKKEKRNLFCHHPSRALHIFAEARIFNYKSHFVFLSIPLFFFIRFSNCE